MRPNSSIISYDQFLTVRSGKKASFLLCGISYLGDVWGGKKASFLLCRISYLVDGWHALWLVKLHHASITCSLWHPILSSSILNVILFSAIYHRLLVKPHPASPQPLPADVVSTPRTKYKNHLTPMGWGGPLSLGRFNSVQHNKKTGHLYSALSDLLISYLPVSCRVAYSSTIS